ncbi:hypothetical protein BLS_000764 [Venturia inaequalis]|uniref:Uncharacterized protein n=1 Tax=Venturia inaequalis TaxID=5025 RepID=A0A8H3Z6Z8_VENIN|nr:hypothetical protein EG327_008907 [Venturia inaequalis]KAE9978253.1 hypothetical protein BLS_000764 [Venturia inaequalis]KAE9987774.1 hypothetical protein EG328_001589 [Venturia inaequalis]RDI80397.1 hypothetical protein Vi05172_g9576 [Venturia inaequalis]
MPIPAAAAGALAKIGLKTPLGAKASAAIGAFVGGAVVCKIKKCKYVVPEVEFHDEATGNTTFSDISVHFPSPDSINRYKAQTGVCGIPNVQFETCTKDLKTVVIKTSTPAPNAAKFEGVPRSCMELSTAMVGACGVAGGAAPAPCGDACLQYSDLSPGQLAMLTSILTNA